MLAYIPLFRHCWSSESNVSSVSSATSISYFRIRDVVPIYRLCSFFNILSKCLWPPPPSWNWDIRKRLIYDWYRVPIKYESSTLKKVVSSNLVLLISLLKSEGKMGQEHSIGMISKGKNALSLQDFDKHLLWSLQIEENMAAHFVLVLALIPSILCQTKDIRLPGTDSNSPDTKVDQVIKSKDKQKKSPLDFLNGERGNRRRDHRTWSRSSWGRSARTSTHQPGGWIIDVYLNLKVIFKIYFKNISFHSRRRRRPHPRQAVVEGNARRMERRGKNFITGVLLLLHHLSKDFFLFKLKPT